MAFYDSIRLEKGMYAAPGKTFTQVLEELDPSANYGGSALAGLDAYQRQVKRFGIKVGGAGSDAVEKFFQTSDSAALFPEYISRAVHQGMERANILPSIVATVTNIQSPDYRTVVSAMTGDDKELKHVGEGAQIPETTLRTQANLVHLHKRGRMLVASYEAIRFQKLDLFTVTLRQIGNYIASALVGDAVEVLLNGDGNENPATSKSLSAAPAYSDMIDLWTSLAPYQLNTILASTDMMGTLLGIAQFQDAQAGLAFQGTGKMATPLGANLFHVPELKEKTLLGLDKNCALEMVQAGDVAVDYDKLIDRQLERAAITVTAGFAKIFTDACRAVTYTVSQGTD